MPEGHKKAFRHARTSAVIVPCSCRKRQAAQPDATAISLPIAQQNQLETAWVERIAAFDKTVQAGDLYCGRGMWLGRRAASETGAPLFIISAGLGLIRSDRVVAPYGLTVGSRGPDAIAARTQGRFDPQSWWRAVSRNDMAQPLASVCADAVGSVLIALTRPYAEMLAGDPASIPDVALSNVRLFGWGLQGLLEARLHGAIMPYDDRLDAALPGTRCDFPQRALLHFTRAVLTADPGASSARHRRAVTKSLARFEAPPRLKRPRATDSEVLEWLARRVEGAGVGLLLRAIRDDGIACEQTRFSRLYRQSREERMAA